MEEAMEISSSNLKIISKTLWKVSLLGMLSFFFFLVAPAKASADCHATWSPPFWECTLDSGGTGSSNDSSGIIVVALCPEGKNFHYWPTCSKKLAECSSKVIACVSNHGCSIDPQYQNFDSPNSSSQLKDKKYTRALCSVDQAAAVQKDCQPNAVNLGLEMACSPEPYCGNGVAETGVEECDSEDPYYKDPSHGTCDSQCHYHHPNTTTPPDGLNPVAFPEPSSGEKEPPVLAKIDFDPAKIDNKGIQVWAEDICDLHLPKPWTHNMQGFYIADGGVRYY